MAPSPENMLVRVTAGPSYDASTHQVVQVNSAQATQIESSACTANISVRIKNYRGLPHGSPATSAYFDAPTHKKDQYSVSFSLLPHKDIAGSALVFGNDIDHPVRDRLPYGTGAAFKIVKTLIDPGLEGDLYSDQPHLYGCALSSFNVIQVGDKAETLGDGKKEGDVIVEEGGSGSGAKWREDKDIPSTADARKKWFLTRGHPDKWTWEAGRVYSGDFFNPYLDFNDFTLKLPGFSLSVLGYMGGEDYLRYVLKNKDTGEVYFVVVFSLLRKEDVEKEEAAATSKETQQTLQADDTAKPIKPDNQPDGGKGFEPKADDLD